MNQPSALNESILVQKLKNHDTSAFTALFTQYYADLVRFSFCFTHDADASKELVQDVFLKLWENRTSLIIHSSLKSYLLKSVQNSSLDWLRHLHIEHNYSSQLLEHPALAENDTENYVFLSELESDFETALKKIPEPFKEAFHMSRMDAMSYQEIADKLGVSVRTVEVRIGKALQLLRHELKDYLVQLILICILFS